MEIKSLFGKTNFKMATTRNIQMQYFNGTDYDTLYPQIDLNNTVGSLDSGKVSGTFGPDKIRGFLPTTGGTLTGNVSLNATPVNNNHIVDKEYVDNAINSNKEYVDSVVSSGDKITTKNGTLNLGLFKSVPVIDFKEEYNKIAGESGGTYGSKVVLVDVDKNFYLRAVGPRNTIQIQKVSLDSNVVECLIGGSFSGTAFNQSGYYYDYDSNCIACDTGTTINYYNFTTGELEKQTTGLPASGRPSVPDYGLQIGNRVYGIGPSDNYCYLDVSSEDNLISGSLVYIDNTPSVVESNCFYVNNLTYGVSYNGFIGSISKYLTNFVLDGYLQFNESGNTDLIVLSSGDTFQPSFKGPSLRPSEIPSGYESHGQSGITISILNPFYPYAFEDNLIDEEGTENYDFMIFIATNNKKYIYTPGKLFCNSIEDIQKDSYFN